MSHENYIIMKNNIIIQILDRWVELQQKGIFIEDFFLENNYKRIAIYGMGILGNRLFESLKDSQIKVEYCIDNHKELENLGYKVYRANDILPDVDVIVSTVVLEWNQIVADLSKRVRCEIIPIQDIFLDR